ncbi:acyl-CoA thioesterase [Georgenia ruanii]|uniref:Acyl-CoA thioesterase n=1 Tax=Georgenia ruanii TaxID=348442 RepID=A0A7J9V053_9MICO|nr:thioesterase family protein [Georgenia ruanii]MPV89344.1 acyl-CoA thioesterase [Georgenia ruanii]
MHSHTVDGTVTWAETDASGRIHNTAVFRWAESAEHALCYRLDPGLAIERIPRRRVEANYHRPLAFRDAYTLTLSVAHLGRTSITYAWTVTSGDELCIEGGHVAVFTDDVGRASPWPETFRAAVSGGPVHHDGISSTNGDQP